jgi:hypothetical protein
MKSWQKYLIYDPIPPLLASENAALRFFVRRDLLGESTGPANPLWHLPDAKRILRKQQPDGSFGFPASRNKHAAINYPLIETWKQFRRLVEEFGCTRGHPPAERAAEFLFSCQTGAGDFRGFLANQYATYYTGAVLSLLIQAGYPEDARVERGIRWLLAMRQNDGGWTVPIITHAFSGKEMYRLTSRRMDPVEPDRSKPFSHNWSCAPSPCIRNTANRTRPKPPPVSWRTGSSSRTRTRHTSRRIIGSGSNTLSGGTTWSPRWIRLPGSGLGRATSGSNGRFDG